MRLQAEVPQKSPYMTLKEDPCNLFMIPSIPNVPWGSPVVRNPSICGNFVCDYSPPPNVNSSLPHNIKYLPMWYMKVSGEYQILRGLWELIMKGRGLLC